MTDYIELHCHSCFSLLDGAASPEALIDRVHALGQPALALTDHADLGGAVRFAGAGRVRGVEAIIGVELNVDLPHAPGARPLVLLADSRTGYGNLCTLVTRARMDRPRGNPAVTLDILAQHAGGLLALTGGPRGWVPSCLAAGDATGARHAAYTLHDIFEDRMAIECWDHGLPEERDLVSQLIPLAGTLGVPWVVTNDVRYARPGDRRVYDVLCALRHKTTLDQMGTRLHPNGEWYLKSAVQMARRWRQFPEGLQATRVIAERCAFRLEQLRPTLPEFPLPPGIGADEYLARLVAHGARERLGQDIPQGHRTQLTHELAVIARLGLAGFFLIVWDIVRFAQRNGILCQGRGSAANSAVCYALGITAVDPVRMSLLFERFLSEERAEPPDIDLDIAHRERERVLQYVYERYGREHAAMVCEQISWRGRSAVRDTARVLGFTVQQAEALAAFSDRFSARATAEALRGRGAADVYTQDNPECLDEEGARAPGRQGGKKEGDDDLAFFSPDSIRRRDAEKKALQGGRAPGRQGARSDHAIADVLGQQLVSGTEAKTRADAVKRSSRMPPGRPAALASVDVPLAPGISDPHAEQDHNERRNPATSLVGSTGATSVLAKAGLDPTDPRVALLADLVEGLHQLPRHRSIHVGGFVLTREPLSRVVPIEPASMPGRSVIQWEKDDLDPVGLVKIDLLGLGMLTLLQDCLLYISRTRGVSTRSRHDTGG